MKSISDHPSIIIPWYVESEFAVLANLRVELAAQAYRAWRRGADKAIAVARSEGCAVQLMPVRLAAFRDWLASERRQDDTASRCAFLVFCAARNGRFPPQRSLERLGYPTAQEILRLH
jgi:hypothetical protein